MSRRSQVGGDMAEAEALAGGDSDEPLEASDGRSVAFTLSRGEPNFITGVLAALALLFVAIAFFVAWYDGKAFPEWPIMIMIAGSISIPLAVNLWMRRRAGADRSEQLVIGVDGVHAPAAAAKFLPWAAIDWIGFREVTHKGRRYNVVMALHLVDSEAFGPRGASWSRWFNRTWYGTEVVCALEPLVGEPEDVVSTVRRFAPAEVIARSDLTIR